MNKFKIRKAIVSVSNKSKLDLLLNYFEKNEIEVFSTGGTYKYIKSRKKNLKLYEISKTSKFPEILDGRVKTLQPFIHAGILADKTNPKHLKQLKKQKICSFELVVVNLYPFIEATQNSSSKFEDCIEKIDIGGPAMIRAAAKNFLHTLILSDPEQYEVFLKQATKYKGAIDLNFRKYLAGEAFNKTAYYDANISSWLNKNFYKKELVLPLKKVKDLRYGENPHQKGSLYKINQNPIKQISGKELSYNNIFDLEIAIQLAYELNKKSCVIVKHGNPCGVSINEQQNISYKKAYKTDRISAFGGIIAFNSELTINAAKDLRKQFCEVIIAPKISLEAKKILSEKKNLILVEYKESKNIGVNFRSTHNFLLIQDQNNHILKNNKLKLMTSRKPSLSEINDIIFASCICKYVNSNAIVIAKNLTSLGIGTGQTNRIEAVEQAIAKMKKNGIKTEDLVLSSDGFFPFDDVVSLCKDNSISAILQPGGSRNDQKVIDSCEKNNISLLFSGIRLFKH